MRPQVHTMIFVKLNNNYRFIRARRQTAQPSLDSCVDYGFVGI